MGQFGKKNGAVKNVKSRKEEKRHFWRKLAPFNHGIKTGNRARESIALRQQENHWELDLLPRSR